MSRSAHMEYSIPSFLPRPPLKRNQPSRQNVISSRNRPQPSVIYVHNWQNTIEPQPCVFRDWKIFWNACWRVWLRSVPIEMKFYVCCSIRHPTYSKLSLTWSPCRVLVIRVQLSLNTPDQQEASNRCGRWPQLTNKRYSLCQLQFR